MTEPLLNLLQRAAPLLPVVTLYHTRHALPLAEALLSGGCRVLEITLRTEAALPSLQALSQVPGLTVGAGTLVDTAQCHPLADAGAAFAVSPGYSQNLADATGAAGLPWLPGVATASEMMQARAQGYQCVKFFPATAMGGVTALQACAAVFPEMTFCPTGGINAENAAAFLALPSVPCVGGSWVVPEHLIAEQDWSAITRLTQQAQRLSMVDNAGETA